MQVFTVRIIYKSGYAMDFECTEFKIEGYRYSWNSYGSGPKPVHLNVDEVASVWQISERKIKE